MLSNNFATIQALFSELIELPEKERTKKIRQLEEENPEIFLIIKELIFADEQIGKQLTAKLAQANDGLINQLSETLTTGQQVGPYRLISELGRGSSGIVFLAHRDDDEYNKKVAIKVLSNTWLDDHSNERFMRERQILANLEHPGIARIMDAGTVEDRPFTVMELIDGNDIKKHTKKNAKTLNDILQLFIKLCDAVQYAHQNLIVHHDLKPDNIIVNAEGQPKLLDFDIARPLKKAGASLEITQITRGIMTPAYASPEQLGYKGTSTASDIYSLGVILYELICGHRPFHKYESSTEELRDAISKHQPPKASTTIDSTKLISNGVKSSHLKGDIDNILTKALQAETNIRYQSVEQFKIDIQAFMNNLPVSAHTPSWIYRTRKFIHRNKVYTAFAVTTLILTLLFSVSTYNQNQKLTTERDKAQSVTNILLTSFQNADPTKTRGESITAREILEQSKSQLPQLKQTDPENYMHLTEILADVYSNIGFFNEAVSLYQATLDTKKQIEGINTSLLPLIHKLANSAIKSGQIELAKTHIALYKKYMDQLDVLTGEQKLMYLTIAATQKVVENDTTAAIGMHNEAFKIAQNVYGETDIRTLEAHFLYAAALFRNGEANLAHLEIIKVSEKFKGHEHENVALYGRVLSRLAKAELDKKNFDQSEKLYNKVIDLYTQYYGQDHHIVATAITRIASFHWSKGELDIAEDKFQEAIALKEKYLGVDNPSVLTDKFNLATILSKTPKKHERADQLFRHVITQYKVRVSPNHYNVGIFLNSHARFLIALDRFEESIERLNMAIEINHGMSETGRNVAVSYTLMGLSLTHLNNRQLDALDYLEQALNILLKRFGNSYSWSTYAIGIVNDMCEKPQPHKVLDRCKFILDTIDTQTQL